MSLAEQRTSADIAVFAGTRPEAIKLAPVVAQARQRGLRVRLVSTGQHPEMVRQGLAPFGLVADEELVLDRGDGGLAELFSGLVAEVDRLLARTTFSVAVVQGDTATTLACALAAFWRGVPVLHVEAGLRTGDLDSPFPEEANRRLVSVVAERHLAPTCSAARALVGEGIPAGRIKVTGNTSVDAALEIARRAAEPSDEQLRAFARGAKRLVLLTVHRRESWGAGIREILAAVDKLVRTGPEIRVVLPAHPNPKVRAQVDAELGGNPAVLVTEPLCYPDLIWALRQADLVITDSGGIQEEAPSFGVPVLVVRAVTERKEALNTGHAVLAGESRGEILDAALGLLSGRNRIPRTGNPFGDGHAAEHTADVLTEMVSRLPRLNELWA